MSEHLKRINRELKFKGTVIDFYQDTIEVDGTHTVLYDFIKHDGAAAVVPVRNDGKILMVRQYRNALDRFTIEIPAGKLDSIHESGLIAAARELEEETGYRSLKMEWLLTLRTALAYCDERIEVYLARDLEQTKQKLDQDEFVEVLAFTIDELKELIFSGKIEDTKTISALLAYESKYLKA